MSSNHSGAEYRRLIAVTLELNVERERIRLAPYLAIRRLDGGDVERLVGVFRSHNPFARTSRNHFYVERLAALTGHTVLEVSEYGKHRFDDLNEVARLGLDACFGCHLLANDRSAFHRQLPQSGREFWVELTERGSYVSARSQREPQSGDGLEVDGVFGRRFERCGFDVLVMRLLRSDGHLTGRIRSALGWVAASRREREPNAAIVKSATAAEALLGERRSATRTLSERLAYLLAEDADKRRRISKAVKRAYNARSRVVHGSKADLENLQRLTEMLDRLTILACLALSDEQRFPQYDALIEWLQSQQWGAPSKGVADFADRYVRNALRLVERPEGK